MKTKSSRTSSHTHSRPTGLLLKLTTTEVEKLGRASTRLLFLYRQNPGLSQIEATWPINAQTSLNVRMRPLYDGLTNTRLLMEISTSSTTTEE